GVRALGGGDRRAPCSTRRLEIGWRANARRRRSTVRGWPPSPPPPQEGVARRLAPRCRELTAGLCHRHVTPRVKLLKLRGAWFLVNWSVSRAEPLLSRSSIRTGPGVASAGSWRAR